MSHWCGFSFRCVIKKEYRELMAAVFTEQDICNKNQEYVEYFEEMTRIAIDLYEEPASQGIRELFIAILKDKGRYSEINDEEEYKELLNAMHIQNECYKDKIQVINTFFDTLNYFYIGTGILSSLLQKNKKDDVELPIFDKETGEYNMYVEYNMRGGYRELIDDLLDLLEYISEKGVEYSDYWDDGG